MHHPPLLHELERQVMEEVWRRGQCSVRDVLDGVNDRSETERAYTTILTVMHRLEAKRMLVRERAGRYDLFTAALTREAYEHDRAAAEVGALVREYGDLALAQFAREIGRLDRKRREQIRRLARGE